MGEQQPVAHHFAFQRLSLHLEAFEHRAPAIYGDFSLEQGAWDVIGAVFAARFLGAVQTEGNKNAARLCLLYPVEQVAMIEALRPILPCDYDPGELTTITRGGDPLRTLARRVDGAFPSPINPIAIWEIKEYYYTTTFGSRVADGVYETLLDGMEIEELREHERIDVKHYLMADAHFTWWKCGKAYLCRMFDMLHMGYADEILFGREVVEEMPRIVSQWVDIHRQRNHAASH